MGIAAAFVVAVVALVLELGSALVERAVDPNRKGTATRDAPASGRTAQSGRT
jgi:hypothetical protein